MEIFSYDKVADFVLFKKNYMMSKTVLRIADHATEITKRK